MSKIDNHTTRAAHTTEHDEQVAIIEWARLNQGRHPCLKWLHSSVNGAKLPYRKTRGGVRYSPEAMRLKAEGLTPGVADIFVPYPVDGYFGLYIELKNGTNKPSDDQVEFLRDMNERGYLAMVCWGRKHAIASIATYLHIPKEDWIYELY